jgi:3-deoxy-D-manno-octulosonate 8-phosphate phosphatase (KDO 8-P phosphatase)
MKHTLRSRKIPAAVVRRAKGIKLLVMDVDGILTDGRVIYTAGGEPQVAFDIQDGHGIKLALRAGLGLAIITGRESEVVAQRSRELGIAELHQKALDKLAVLQGLVGRCGLALGDVACMGDDLPDLPLLLRVGLAVTVPGAVDEVRAAAHYVTRRPGGRGAVRETIELLLKAQGHWATVTERYRR